MLRVGLPLFLAAYLFFCAQLKADEYRLEKVAEAPKGVAKEIGENLKPDGFRVIKGTSRTVCQIWLSKSWSAKTMTRKGDILYPFEVGQLIGVIQYSRKGADFRDQSIAKGTYTLRYGQQPEDGAHVGTFPTRDFLLLLPAAVDKKLAPLDPKKLVAGAVEAAEGGHPAMLCLQKPAADPKVKVRHNEDHDWWIVDLEGSLTVNKKSQPLRMGLIVAGIAEE